MDTLRKLHALLSLIRWVVTIVVLLASGTMGTGERETGPIGPGGSEAVLVCPVYEEGRGSALFSGSDDLRIESSVTVAPDGRQLVSSVTVSRHGDSYSTTVTLELAVPGAGHP
jgi:hypothetical protein